MKESLNGMLKQLRLSGLRTCLEVRLEEARSHHLHHEEFLELILQDELSIRKERGIRRRVKTASFRELKTLEDFDWQFNPSIPRAAVYQLATGQFIRKAEDVLFLGPPGVGKSHLAQALGYQAIKIGFSALYRSIFDVVREFLEEESLGGNKETLQNYITTDFLIVDDMGMKQLPKRSGECLLEVIMRRHQTRSTLMTSNRPIEEWGKLIGDVPSATAILDRFLQNAQIFEFTGRSYRLKDRAGQGTN